jgi:phosphoglycolate phosphatase-like HAD superfamily hydrolase
MLSINLKNYKLIFWDFDGVIKESVEVKSRAFCELFDSFDLTLKERIRIHHQHNGGLSRFEKMPIYLKWAGLPASPEDIKDYCERFSAKVQQNVINSPWVAGAEDYLRSNKYKQLFVLISATPQHELEQILCALNLINCFEGIYGAPIFKKDAINDALAKSQLKPLECLVIGDAVVDLDAAISHGIPFLLRRHASNREVFQSHIGPSVENFKSK